MIADGTKVCRESFKTHGLLCKYNSHAQTLKENENS